MTVGESTVVSQRRIVAATSVCMIAAAAPPFLVGVIVLQMRQDFAFTAMHLALAVAVYFATSAIVSPVSGPLIRRVGSHGCLMFSTLLAAVAMALMAIAWDWRVVIAAQFVAGVGNSVVQPAVSRLVSRAISLRYRGLALGLNQSAIPLSTLIVAMLVPALALTVGWRWCAWLMAGLSFVVIGLISRRPLPSDREASRPADPAAGRLRPRRLSRSNRVALFALAGLFASMAATNIPSFLTVSAVGSGMSQSQSALMQIIGSLLCIGVRVVSGWLGAGKKPDYLLAVACMLLLGGIGYACISTGSQALVAMGAILAFGFGWGWSGLFNLSIVLRFSHDVAGVTVITQAGVYTGATFGPVIFGFLLDSWGLRASWWMATCCAVMAALLVLAARSRGQPRL